MIPKLDRQIDEAIEVDVDVACEDRRAAEETDATEG